MVVMVGVTLCKFPIKPLLHVYVLAPVTFRVLDAPRQITDELAVALRTGKAITETFLLALPTQPFVPVHDTVINVFVVGEKVKVLPIKLLLQVNEGTLAVAVNVIG